VMVTQRMVHSLPKITITHRRHLPKAFPAPMIFAPLAESESQPPRHITIIGNQRHPRWLIKGLQPPHHGQ
jgi:hypothetical protein